MAHWYPGLEDGLQGEFSLSTLDWLTCELIGAGVIASESTEYKYDGGNKAAYDITADGRKINVKAARWHRKRSREFIGVPSPGKAGAYNPEVLDELVLVLTEFLPRVSMDYREDGSLSVTAVATPSYVWRLPVEDMNRLMREDGKSQQRWLVRFDDLAPYLIRSV
ncbi:hypothetical protein GXB85_05330 [Cellulomonas sp. APG4]|uniref:hypothetical protein n=1 Tax=Cellulomonas sp. APG4 TaxID=1538656 RepID=UPI00137B79C7|nr:hypothetical protein [Cellulomonas sp. APG4]NCT90373.1 hypothetical protein [Cellulomonas sp. APG4]